MHVNTIQTPALLLDKQRFINNCQRMKNRIANSSVVIRAHMKTAKCFEVLDYARLSGQDGITVSTLAEADYFAENGVNDILYAVAIVPDKLDRVARLTNAGINMRLICDNLAVLEPLNNKAEQLGIKLDLLIEIDCGGNRGGVEPHDELVVQMADKIKKSIALNFLGVMTHAGQSYHCHNENSIKQVAEIERHSVVDVANRLKTKGHECLIISVGSTPTACFASSYQGLSEIRPGVYMFSDVNQYYLKTCQLSDIAITVLASVIGHNHKAKRIIIDAGGLALSKDRSGDEFSNAAGFGLIADLSGNLHRGLYIDSVHQEHGLIADAVNQEPPYELMPIGSKIRVLPIHVCMTAAAFNEYHVHDEKGALIDKWSRINGW